MCIYIYIYVHVYTYMHIYIYLYMHVSYRKYPQYIQLQKYIYQSNIYIHIYINVHIYIRLRSGMASKQARMEAHDTSSARAIQVYI